jgi:hypothetical protein
MDHGYVVADSKKADGLQFMEVACRVYVVVGKPITPNLVIKTNISKSLPNATNK